MSQRGGSSAGWCFTWFVSQDPKGFDELAMRPTPDKFFESVTSYMIYQLEECPTTGNIHYQGYLHFPRRVALSTVLKHIPVAFRQDPFTAPHFTQARGSPTQNRAYCSKEETRVPEAEVCEFGEFPSQGKRSDLIPIHTSLVAGESVSSIVRSYPSSIYRVQQLISARNILFQSPTARDIYVRVYWGESGAGKTFAAMSQYGADAFKLTENPNKTLWFDGYHGQRVLIIDDYHNWIPFRTLITLLDPYPQQLQMKGTFGHAQWDTVIITTNIHPTNWYSDEREMRPLMRRLLSPPADVFIGAEPNGYFSKPEPRGDILPFGMSEQEVASYASICASMIPSQPVNQARLEAMVDKARSLRVSETSPPAERVGPESASSGAPQSGIAPLGSLASQTLEGGRDRRVTESDSEGSDEGEYVSADPNDWTLGLKYNPSYLHSLQAHLS